MKRAGTLGFIKHQKPGGGQLGEPVEGGRAELSSRKCRECVCGGRGGSAFGPSMSGRR